MQTLSFFCLHFQKERYNNALYSWSTKIWEKWTGCDLERGRAELTSSVADGICMDIISIRSRHAKADWLLQIQIFKSQL